jgi:class 3 adenylate cyclase
MELKYVSLVLADISGYTRFMKQHTTSLLHAEQIITELLEAIIDNSEHPLQVSKIEGDAVFFYAESGSDHAAAAKDVVEQVLRFFEAFQAKAQILTNAAGCPCDACTNISQLKLKAILHHGEVAFKRIRQFEELAGQDVILAHRLLKNAIPSKEYILMTREFYRLSGGLPNQKPEVRVEYAEGIGKTDIMVYYPGAQTEVQIATSLGTKLSLALRFGSHSMLRLLKLKPAGNFSNLPQ